MAQRKTPPRRSLGSRPDGYQATSIPFKRLSDIPGQQPKGIKVSLERAPLEVRQVAIDVYNTWRELCEPGNNTPLDQRSPSVVGSAMQIAESLILHGVQHHDYVRLHLLTRFRKISDELLTAKQRDDTPSLTAPFALGRFTVAVSKEELELTIARKCSDDEMRAIREEEAKINPLETLFHELGYTEALIHANVEERGFGPLSAKWLLIDIGNFAPYTAVLLFPRDDRILAHFGAEARARVYGNAGLIHAIRQLPAYRLFNDIDVNAFLHFIETGYKMA